jgi:hypothetical protein
MGRFSNRRFLACLGLLLVAPVLIGCGGSKRVTVRGKVKYQDKPVTVEGVRVSFIGADGAPRTVGVDPNGDYELPGVLPGDNQVLVSCVLPPPEKQPAKPVPGARSAPEKTPPKTPFPMKYSQPDKSDLRCTVEPDRDNVYNIDLKDD